MLPLESLGDSITTAVVVQWQKDVGDVIKEDDVIAVVETDKVHLLMLKANQSFTFCLLHQVTMDIRAKQGGVFVERLVTAGSEASASYQIYDSFIL